MQRNYRYVRPHLCRPLQATHLAAAKLIVLLERWGIFVRPTVAVQGNVQKAYLCLLHAGGCLQVVSLLSMCRPVLPCRRCRSSSRQLHWYSSNRSFRA